MDFLKKYGISSSISFILGILISSFILIGFVFTGNIDAKEYNDLQEKYAVLNNENKEYKNEIENKNNELNLLKETNKKLNYNVEEYEKKIVLLIDDIKKYNTVYVVSQPVDENDNNQGMLIVPNSFSLDNYLNLYKENIGDTKETILNKLNILENVNFEESSLDEYSIDIFNSKKQEVINSLRYKLKEFE